MEVSTMFALSPNIFPSAIGWQLEESMIDELHNGDLFASYTTSSPDQLLPAEFEYRDDLRSSSTPAAKRQTNPAKKSTHNEYERHRRKKLNSLYSSLRNLLPETDRSRNMSIPCTVGRVLKYIPELQRQIKRLTQRKEDILVRASQEGALASTLSYHLNREDADHPIISSTYINRREVMVQICTFHKSKTVSVSKIVRVLEEEGLHLMIISTQSSLAGKTICSLHLQAKEDSTRTGSQSFSEHLMNLLKNGPN